MNIPSGVTNHGWKLPLWLPEGILNMELYISHSVAAPLSFFLQHKKLQHGKYHRKNAVILKPLGHDFLGFWLTEMEISWDITNAGNWATLTLESSGPGFGEFQTQELGDRPPTRVEYDLVGGIPTIGS